MLAGQKGVVPHSNVVMATLEPIGYNSMDERVFSLLPGQECAVYLEAHIAGIHHASDEIFLPVPSLLHGIRMASALERRDSRDPVPLEYYHPVYQALRSNGQCEEPMNLMLYWTRPFLSGERPYLTIYNSTKEERTLEEVSKGSILLLVSYSVFIRGGSSYPTAEILFGAFQDETGEERVDAILRTIGKCLRNAAMGRVHSVIGRYLCCVSDPWFSGLRIYDLPTIRESAAYQNHRVLCEQVVSCKCELNAEMLEEEAEDAREAALTWFEELIPQLQVSMASLSVLDGL